MKPELPEVVWHCPGRPPFRLSGFPWFEQDRVYRRLPLKPAWQLPAPVSSLADCTAGGQVRFRTDSEKIFLKVVLSGPSGMHHMPATGQSGFDVYVGPVGKAKYCGTLAGSPADTTYQGQLLELPGKVLRVITINFPLYQGVKELSLGLLAGARLLPPPAYEGSGRIIVYGTSITQGGCASRPGMAYTNILSRRFNYEFINLGFSGSGRGEPEMACLLAEIPRPAAYLLDYQANAQGLAGLRQTLPEFIRLLREKHPRVPILVISRLPYARIGYDQAARQEYLRSRDFQASLVKKLRRQGERLTFFHDGQTLLGKKDWWEATVDGVHPTDLGFLRMADGLTPVLKRILPGTRR